MHSHGHNCVNKNNRTQKAVVEFIWIGGQFVGIPLDRSIDVCNPQSTILSSSNFCGGDLTFCGR